MARQRHSDEDILRSLRAIKVHLYGGMDVASACRTAGISDKTYYGWLKRYGGIGRAKLSEFKALEKEKHRLKKILAELELDKLILKKALIIKSLGPECRVEAANHYSCLAKAKHS